MGVWGPEAETWGLHPHWPLGFGKPIAATRALSPTLDRPEQGTYTGFELPQVSTMGSKLAVLPKATQTIGGWHLCNLAGDFCLLCRVYWSIIIIQIHLFTFLFVFFFYVDLFN